MNVSRILPIFSAAFAVIYAIAVEANLAAVTYHPKTGEWGVGAQLPVNGPAMHWYGWLITAAAGAAAMSVLALPFVRHRSPPVWIGWAVPLAVMLSFIYFLRSFFIY